MLVLSRRTQESIVIAGNITITVVEIRGGKVRLGITAPQSVPVHRSEVWAAIHAAGGDGNEAAEAEVEQLIRDAGLPPEFRDQPP